MTKSKHTPGKWNKVVRTDGRLYVGTEQKPIVDVCLLYDEESEANARLVAAAPELLRAVEELVFEQCQLTCKDHDRECEPTCWVLKHKQLIARINNDESQKETKESPESN